MTYYNLELVIAEEPDASIPMSLAFIPRPGDYLRTSHLNGHRGFQVVAVYAPEREQHSEQGLIQVLVRAVTIPDVFTKP